MKLTVKNAKDYAKDKFKSLPKLYQDWQFIHSRGIIEIISAFSDSNFDKEKLYALAWIHDIGKIKSEENHAEIGFDILKEDFELDNVSKDCILNHGSSSKPETKEGGIFRYADGLSLFTKEVIMFRFFSEAKEGFSFEEIKNRIEEDYNKYKLKYSDSKEILKLLDNLYKYNLIF